MHCPIMTVTNIVKIFAKITPDERLRLFSPTKENRCMMLYDSIPIPDGTRLKMPIKIETGLRKEYIKKLIS